MDFRSISKYLHLNYPKGISRLLEVKVIYIFSVAESNGFKKMECQGHVFWQGWSSGSHKIQGNPLFCSIPQ